MAVSRKLSELVKDATLGLSQIELVELTGLTTATLSRMKAGHIVSQAMLLQFANGLRIDPGPLLDAVSEATKKPVACSSLFAALLERTGWSAASKLEVMQHLRQVEERELKQRSTSASSQAA